MTDQIAGTTLISSATYGSANQLLTITGTPYAANYTETRSNNSLKQLTQITSGGLSIDYNYPSTNNNGKIASQTDSISGETVTYTYDSLNRLATAQNQTGFTPLWGQSFTYDGFSNLTGTSVTQGSAPTLSASYDVNNHAGGEDANGNPGSIYLPADGSSYSATYDVENRLRSTGSSTIFYSYAPGNRRVWQGTGSWTATYGTCNPTPGSAEVITFWGVNGQKLMTYNLTEGFVGSQCHFTATAIGTNYYFGNRLIKNTGGYVYPDRLGSIGKFYPYGIERPSATTNGTEKFTGYLRDAESGNDYAINRYITPGTGRFITADSKGGRITDPGSLNKYAYTGGDPINRVDRNGRDWCVGPGDCEPDDICSNNDNDGITYAKYCLGGYYSDNDGFIDDVTTTITYQTSSSDDTTSAPPTCSAGQVLSLGNTCTDLITDALDPVAAFVLSSVYNTVSSLTTMAPWVQFTGASMAFGGLGAIGALAVTPPTVALAPSIFIPEVQTDFNFGFSIQIPSTAVSGSRLFGGTTQMVGNGTATWVTTEAISSAAPSILNLPSGNTAVNVVPITIAPGAFTTFGTAAGGGGFQNWVPYYNGQPNVFFGVPTTIP